MQVGAITNLGSLMSVSVRLLVQLTIVEGFTCTVIIKDVMAADSTMVLDMHALCVTNRFNLTF